LTNVGEREVRLAFAVDDRRLAGADVPRESVDPR
jgi:hypothetical protein